jgi:protein TonB
MKVVLVLFSMFLFVQFTFSQGIPNQVVFKVRKKPAQVTVVEKAFNAASFLVVEEPATFQRGDLSNFNVWVIQNIKYPQLAVENQIEGKVYVQFVVNEMGKVEDVKVLRGVDPILDAEAVRVISASPLWTPPRQGGRKVKQIITLPVIFKLQE